MMTEGQPKYNMITDQSADVAARIVELEAQRKQASHALNATAEDFRDAKTKLAAIEAERATHRAIMSDVDRTLAILRGQLQPKYQPQPKKRQEPNVAAPAPVLKREPRMTDHAVIRFLERKYGFDFTDLKISLMTTAMKLACNMGAQSVKAHGGRFVIKDGAVVTFTD